MAKLTFRKAHRPGGLRGMADTPSTEVKLDGKVVGSLAAPSFRENVTGWGVSLMVHDATVHCGWRWLSFAKRHDDEATARSWLVEHWDVVTAKYSVRAA